MNPFPRVLESQFLWKLCFRWVSDFTDRIKRRARTCYSRRRPIFRPLFLSWRRNNVHPLINWRPSLKRANTHAHSLSGNEAGRMLWASICWRWRGGQRGQLIGFRFVGSGFIHNGIQIYHANLFLISELVQISSWWIFGYGTPRSSFSRASTDTYDGSKQFDSDRRP